MGWRRADGFAVSKPVSAMRGVACATGMPLAKVIWGGLSRMFCWSSPDQMLMTETVVKPIPAAAKASVRSGIAGDSTKSSEPTAIANIAEPIAVNLSAIDIADKTPPGLA